MVRARESLVTESAGERFLPGMTPIVSGKLVRPPKGPVASLPRTAERFLPRVDATVSLEVGALGIHLSAARMITAVHLLELAV